jgi:hypothetical protein
VQHGKANILPVTFSGLSFKLERTPEGVAVSGIDGRSRQERKNKNPGVRRPKAQNSPAGIPRTNSSPLLDTLPHYLDVGDNAQANVDEGIASEFTEKDWREYVKNPRIFTYDEKTKSYKAPTVEKPEYSDRANLLSWVENTCDSKRWFIPGACDDSKHRFAKTIVCGKEWCPSCGKRNSMAHNRRFVRWLVKIQQFKSMRYFVFTIPEDIRGRYRTKKSLAALGRNAQRIMQDHGFKRGLRRYHFFGDRSIKWHPHINILVEGRYLRESILDSIKKEWASVLGVVSNNYNPEVDYKSRPADMVGCLNYVTRSTFRDCDWDIDMACELKNFRNMVVWGRDWHGEKLWQIPVSKRVDAETGDPVNIEAVTAIAENKVCPICGSHITWHKNALPCRLLDLVDKEGLGAGYYRILDRPAPVMSLQTYAREVLGGIDVRRGPPAADNSRGRGAK